MGNFQMSNALHPIILSNSSMTYRLPTRKHGNFFKGAIPVLYRCHIVILAVLCYNFSEIACVTLSYLYCVHVRVRVRASYLPTLRINGDYSQVGSGLVSTCHLWLILARKFPNYQSNRPELSFSFTVQLGWISDCGYSRLQDCLHRVDASCLGRSVLLLLMMEWPSFDLTVVETWNTGCVSRSGIGCWGFIDLALRSQVWSGWRGSRFNHVRERGWDGACVTCQLVGGEKSEGPVRKGT